MRHLRFSAKGIPILTLDEKIKALGTCIKDGSREDVLGHLFDLMNHVAPGYKFGKFKNIGQLAAHYGETPTPLEGSE